MPPQQLGLRKEEEKRGSMGEEVWGGEAVKAQFSVR